MLYFIHYKHVCSAAYTFTVFTITSLPVHCSNQLHYISDEIYMNSVHNEAAEFISALNIEK